MLLLPLFALLRRIPKPTHFLPPFFPPPETSSFRGTSTSITFSGNQKLLPTYVRRKYSIGSSPLNSFLSMKATLFSIAIHLLFSIAPLAVAPSWQSLLLSLLSRSVLLLEGASGPGFRSPTNSTNRISFSGLSPQRLSPFLEFSESSLG